MAADRGDDSTGDDTGPGWSDLLQADSGVNAAFVRQPSAAIDEARGSDADDDGEGGGRRPPAPSGESSLLGFRACRGARKSPGPFDGGFDRLDATDEPIPAARNSLDERGM